MGVLGLGCRLYHERDKDEDDENVSDTDEIEDTAEIVETGITSTNATIDDDKDEGRIKQTKSELLKGESTRPTMKCCCKSSKTVENMEVNNQKNLNSASFENNMEKRIERVLNVDKDENEDVIDVIDDDDYYWD